MFSWCEDVILTFDTYTDTLAAFILHALPFHSSSSFVLRLLLWIKTHYDHSKKETDSA